MSYQIDTLRDALTAACPAMTSEQQAAADALLAALTPPRAAPSQPPPARQARPAGRSWP